jgi:hypothetical protein
MIWSPVQSQAVKQPTGLALWHEPYTTSQEGLE